MKKVYEAVKQNEYCKYDSDTGEFTIKLQHGAKKEVGVNGGDINELIWLYKDILTKFNSGDGGFKCCQNDAILALCDCILELAAQRTQDRTARGVEGYNKA